MPGTLDGKPAPVLFTLVSEALQGKPTVPAVKAVCAGIYQPVPEGLGHSWTPCLASIRAALPYRLHAAWDRSGAIWWNKEARFNTETGRASHCPTIHLKGYRGKPLASITVIPYQYDDETRERRTGTPA
jgi:hypothetical protein